MRSTDIPAKFQAAWANAAASQYVKSSIPIASQQSSGTPNAASLADGYPPDTGIPTSAGGKGPLLADTNGVFQMITKLLIWAQAGGEFPFDATFAAAIGGYPKYATLASTTTGQFWQNTVDNNMTDPDGSGAAGWQSIFAGLATSAQLTAEAAARGAADTALGVRISTLFSRQVDLTSTATLGTAVINPYNTPLLVTVVAISQAALANLRVRIDGGLAAYVGAPSSGIQVSATVMVPPGSTFIIDNTVAAIEVQAVRGVY